MGEPAYHLVAELVFESREAMKAAFASEEWKASGSQPAGVGRHGPGHDVLGRALFAGTRRSSERMTTASGVREVPQPRAEVWRALAVLEPYCAVCDVSYVVAGAGRARDDVRLRARPARRRSARRPAAPQGEIVDWQPQRLVTTRLVLTPETWTTRIELADADGGGTRVTMTVTHEPRGGSRVVRRLQRGALQRLVQRTVDARAGEGAGAHRPGGRLITIGRTAHRGTGGYSAVSCAGVRNR